jgi:phosphatidylinositol glycan class T
MPYNVIILTSTVMALAFGMVFNLLVRRFVGVDEAEKWDVRAVRLKIAGLIKGLARKFKRKEEHTE